MSHLDTIKADALDQARGWIIAHNAGSCDAASPIDCQRENISAAIVEVLDEADLGFESLLRLALEEIDLMTNEVDASELGGFIVTPLDVLRRALLNEVTDYVFEVLADDAAKAAKAAAPIVEPWPKPGERFELLADHRHVIGNTPASQFWTAPAGSRFTAVRIVDHLDWFALIVTFDADIHRADGSAIPAGTELRIGLGMGTAKFSRRLEP